MYVDGMHLYQYVGSEPLRHTDPTGLGLCVYGTANEYFRGRIKALVKVLAPQARLDGDTFELDSAGTLPEKLVMALIKGQRTTWLQPDATNYYKISTNRNFEGSIHFNTTPDGRATYYLDVREPFGLDQYIAPRTNDPEYALSLAHEMIHSYHHLYGKYYHTGNVLATHLLQYEDPPGAGADFHVARFGGEGASLPMEEAFTIGLDVVTAVVEPKSGSKGKIRIDRYDDVYTEQNIARALGSPWRRRAWHVGIQFPFKVRNISPTDYINDWDVEISPRNR